MTHQNATQSTADVRLSPPRSHSRYYHLRCLRSLIEQAVADRLMGRKGLKLVDLGCGSMPYRSLIEPHVDQYIGVDLERNCSADMHLTSGFEVPLQDQSIDVVLSTQVLEHVIDPKLYLAEAYRILKPEGVLLLTTHGYWRYHPDPTDCWRWTIDGLQRTLESASFRVARIRGAMGLTSSGMQLMQDGLLDKMPATLHRPFCFFVQQAIRAADQFIDKRSIRRDAGLWLAIAEKPQTEHSAPQ